MKYITLFVFIAISTLTNAGVTLDSETSNFIVDVMKEHEQTVVEKRGTREPETRYTFGTIVCFVYERSLIASCNLGGTGTIQVGSNGRLLNIIDSARDDVEGGSAEDLVNLSIFELNSSTTKIQCVKSHGVGEPYTAACSIKFL